MSSVTSFVEDCFGENIVTPAIEALFHFKWVQAVSYLLLLLYLFLGIAIVADIFMCAIEKITSNTKVVKVKTGPAEDDIEEVEVKVRI